MHPELCEAVMKLSRQSVLKLVSWDVMSWNLIEGHNLLYNPTTSNFGALKDGDSRFL
jgi:hypothetical protein